MSKSKPGYVVKLGKRIASGPVPHDTVWGVGVLKHVAAVALQ